MIDFAGSPTISGVTLSGDSRTLTCTSTGGPATFVVWRQNCIILQQNDANYVQNQTVTSTLAATYENTLEINNITVSNGVYTCSVCNSRGYDSSSVGVGSKFKKLCVASCVHVGIRINTHCLPCCVIMPISCKDVKWIIQIKTFLHIFTQYQLITDLIFPSLSALHHPVVHQWLVKASLSRVNPPQF